MKERLGELQGIRAALPENMALPFDIVISVYEGMGIDPKIVKGASGDDKIQELTFGPIPRKVMSQIFRKIMEQKDNIVCGCELSSRATKSDEDFVYSVTLTEQVISF